MQVEALRAEGAAGAAGVDRWASRLGSARADNTRRFKVEGLPPGDFLPAAIDASFDPENDQPRALLERLRPGPTPVVLSEGE
jgi:hypothetical protein